MSRSEELASICQALRELRAGHRSKLPSRFARVTPGDVESALTGSILAGMDEFAARWHAVPVGVRYHPVLAARQTKPRAAGTTRAGSSSLTARRLRALGNRDQLSAAGTPVSRAVFSSRTVALRLDEHPAVAVRVAAGQYRSRSVLGHGHHLLRPGRRSLPLPIMPSAPGRARLAEVRGALQRDSAGVT